MTCVAIFIVVADYTH